MADEPAPAEAEDELPQVTMDGDVAAEVPKPAAPEPPSVGIEDLQRQLEATSRQREQATQAARKAQQERNQWAAYAQQAQARGISAAEVANETKMASLHSQRDAIVEAQQTAMEAGEWRKVAEFNRELADASSTLRILELEKTQLQQHREQFIANAQRQQQQPAQPQQPQITDPVERAIASRTRPTQEFLRKHKEVFRADGSFKKYAVDLHEKLMDEGVRVDTDDYFRRMEEGLAGGGDIRTRAVRDDVNRPKGPPTAAAPVSRAEAPGGNRGRLDPRGEIHMTPRRLEAAEVAGLSPREWAKYYIEGVNSGRMEPFE